MYLQPSAESEHLHAFSLKEPTPPPLLPRVMTAPGPVVLFNNLKGRDYSLLHRMIPSACNLAMTFSAQGGDLLEAQGQGSDTPCKLATGDSEGKQAGGRKKEEMRREG